MDCSKSSCQLGTSGTSPITSPLPTFPMVTDDNENCVAFLVGKEIDVTENKICSGAVIGNTWKIGEVIGDGSFGTVYSCEDLRNHKFYALKTETRTPVKWMEKKEFEFLLALRSVKGFPQLKDWGCINGSSWLTMTMLGPSLESLFRFCDRKFSHGCIVKMGDQIISRLEELHSRGMLHRDIKPDNLLVGFGRKCGTIYLADFGLAKFYMTKSGRHKPYNVNRPLIGTSRYASLNNHFGIEQSRRDDLESFWYMLVYFFKGSLPWQGAGGRNNHEKLNHIAKMKARIPISQLCEGIPIEFIDIIEYIRSLEYERDPDYKYIRNLMWHSLPNHRSAVTFDWDIKINN